MTEAYYDTVNQLIEDRFWGHGFGDREININDEYGRGDLAIFAEASQMDFPLDEYPECKYPDIMELFTMEQAHKLVIECFESNIEYTLPYRVDFCGQTNKILEFARKNTACRVRIYPGYMLMEDKSEHALVHLNFKLPYKYQPTLYTVRLGNETEYDDNKLLKWIKENLGDFRFICDDEWTNPNDNTYAFYSNADAVLFKMRWI